MPNVFGVFVRETGEDGVSLLALFSTKAKAEAKKLEAEKETFQVWETGKQIPTYAVVEVCELEVK
jgi:hypothetical protein